MQLLNHCLKALSILEDSILDMKVENVNEGGISYRGGSIGDFKNLSLLAQEHKTEAEKGTMETRDYTGSVQLLDLRPVPRHSGYFTNP